MPSSTERQRNFMGAELGRLRAGEKTQTGMSESQLRDFAKKSKKGKKGKRKQSKSGKHVGFFGTVKK